MQTAALVIEAERFERSGGDRDPDGVEIVGLGRSGQAEVSFDLVGYPSGRLDDGGPVGAIESGRKSLVGSDPVRRERDAQAIAGPDEDPRDRMGRPGPPFDPAEVVGGIRLRRIDTQFAEGVERPVVTDDAEVLGSGQAGHQQLRDAVHPLVQVGPYRGVLERHNGDLQVGRVGRGSPSAGEAMIERHAEDEDQGR